jgi:hypothetical protein
VRRDAQRACNTMKGMDLPQRHGDTESAKVATECWRGDTLGNSDGYRNKGVGGKAIRKSMKTKGEANRLSGDRWACGKTEYGRWKFEGTGGEASARDRRRSKIAGGVRGDNWSEGGLRGRWPKNFLGIGNACYCNFRRTQENRTRGRSLARRKADPPHRSQTARTDSG